MLIFFIALVYISWFISPSSAINPWDNHSSLSYLPPYFFPISTHPPLLSSSLSPLLCFFLSLQDYSWEDHGFSLVNRLYSDIGQLLDEKFRMVRNLTYNTMAIHEDVDTTTLRRAIWNYVHCMFGIR